MFQSQRYQPHSRPVSSIERCFYGELVAELARRRVAIGLTQEQLDQQLGVSEGQIAKWESFARLPGAFMFVCWSNALGVTLTTAVQPQSKAA